MRGKEVPGAERGNLVAVRFAAAAQEQSWGSCKGLGRVGRGGGRGAGRVGGDGGEDLLHQGPCSSDCHHLSLLAPVQRTRHSSHGLTGGAGVGCGGQSGVGTSRKKKGGGTWGPRGAGFSQALTWDQGGGLEKKGLSGRAEGKNYAQSGCWLFPPA